MIVFKLLLIVVVYVGVAILLAWLLARPCQTPRAKAIAATLTLLVFALIPTWDIVPGKLYFNHLCETEGGIKIYRTVEGVEGFLTQDPSLVRDALQKHGFKYVETRTVSGGFTQYSLNDTGQVNTKELRRSSARYSHQLGVTNRAPSVQSFVEAIVDTTTGEKLAVRTQFAYAGNWVQRKASPLLGGGEFCSSVPVRKLFLETFLRAAPKANK